MNFVGNILQNSYHVHADPHLSAALLCYLDETGAETSLLLTAYCIE